MKKINEFEQKQLIAEHIVSLREQVENLKKTKDVYFAHAVEAAENDNNDYANEMLEAMEDISGFIFNLSHLELEIRTNAMTASAISKLKDLPAVLSACGNMCKQTPNFDGLKKQMSEVSKTIANYREAIKGIRVDKKSNASPTYRELFGEKTDAVDSKRAQHIAELRKNLEAELAKRRVNPVQSPAVSNTAANKAADNSASADRIADMLDFERKRP